MCIIVARKYQRDTDYNQRLTDFYEHQYYFGPV